MVLTGATGPTPDAAASQEALKSACDVMKVSTGLATGTLLFSVGFLAQAPFYDATARIALAATWVLLVLSVCFGLMSQAAVPVLMADRNYDIEAPTFTWPGRIHQIFFVLAIVLLAFTQARTVFSEPAPNQLRASTVEQAVDIGRQALGPRDEIDKLTSAELIKGTQQDRVGNMAWHIQFEVRTHGGTPRFVDVLIDAQSGVATRLQTPPPPPKTGAASSKSGAS